MCLSLPLLEPEKTHADEPASRRTKETNVAAAMAVTESARTYLLLAAAVAQGEELAYGRSLL
jgi:hypothetical protein